MYDEIKTPCHIMAGSINVSIYVFMYVCMYVYMYVCMCLQKMCLQKISNTHARAHTHTHTHTHTRDVFFYKLTIAILQEMEDAIGNDSDKLLVFNDVKDQVMHMYVCIYKCIYIYIYIYINTFVYTHTHTVKYIYAQTYIT